MLAIDFDAPPSLSVAFADYRAHDTLALVQTDGFNPRIDNVDEEVPVVGGGSSLDADRIQRRHRLGKAGVTVMIIGASATVVGVGVAVVGGAGGNLGLATLGLGLAVGGGIAFTVGEVMMFTGGIGAASLLGESTTVGWVGVGLIAGGYVLNVVGPRIDPSLSGIGGALGIAGLVCGAVQLGQAGRAGRDAGVISWHVAPMDNGLRIGGTF